MAADPADNIDVKVELRNELSGPAAEMTLSLKELENQAKDTRRQLALLEVQIAATGKAAKRASANISQHTAAMKGNVAQTNKATQATNRNTTTTNRATTATRRSTKATKDADKGWKGFIKTLKSVLGWAAKTFTALKLLSIGMLGVAAAAKLATYVQGVGAMIPALAQLGALAAFIPTALGSLVAIMLTMKVVFNGVGAAIGAAVTGNLTQFDAKLKKLTPEARAFVLEIAKFAPAFKKMQNTVQASFFGQIKGQITPLVKNLLPALTNGMSLVAQSAGVFASELLGFFSSTAGSKFISAIFVGGSDLINALSKGILPLLNGFKDLMLLVAPMWKRFTDNVGDLAVRFGNWLSEVANSGQLATWIQGAVDTAKALWQILSNVWGILSKVFQAMGDGTAILTTLGILLGNVNAFLASDAGQEGMAAIFSTIASLATTLAPLLSIVGDAIAKTVAPAILDIVTNLAPGFEQFLLALSSALQTLAPFWGPLAKGLGDMLTALAPLLPFLAQIVGYLGGLLGLVLSNLAKIIGPIIQTVLAPLVEVWASLSAILIKNGPMINQIFDAFGKVFQAFLPFGMALAKLISEGFNKFIPIMEAALAQAMPVILQFIDAMTKFAEQVVVQLLPYLPQLVDTFFQLLGAFFQLLPAILPIITALTKLILEVIIPNLPVFLFLAKVVLTVVTAFLTLLAIVIQVMAAIITPIAKFYAFMIGFWGGLFNIIITPFKNALDWVAKNFIDPLFKKITDLGNALSSLLGGANAGGLGKAVSNVLGARAMGGPVEAGGKYLTGELGPEIFMDQMGNTRMLGQFGPRVEQFTKPGFVIPNHLMDAFGGIEDSMRRQQAAMKSRSEGNVLATVGRNTQTTEVYEGDSYDVDVHFHGKVDSEIDIERTIKRTIKKVERDKRERR